HAAPPALRPLRAPAALSAAPFRPHRDRRGHRDADCRVGAGRWLYRRCLRVADRAGRHAPDDLRLHVHSEPGARRGGGRALPGAGLFHPENAAENPRARARGVRKVRTLSDRIGESIAAQVEIRTNAGAQHQLADISHRLGEIYDIRFDIYNRKFFVKFLNYLINQLTPFFFFLIGGYFVITGELSFGALVAVLAAYKELSSPWKELLDFYQNQQDVAIKYEQVVEQFQVAHMLDPRLLLDDEGDKVEPPQGEVELTNVGVVDSDGIRLLDGLSLAFPLGTHVALVGPSNGGKNLLPQLLARLDTP